MRRRCEDRRDSVSCMDVPSDLYGGVRDLLSRARAPARSRPGKPLEIFPMCPTMENARKLPEVPDPKNPSKIDIDPSVVAFG